MDKQRKIIIIIIGLVLLMSLIVALPFLSGLVDAGSSPVLARATQKTCDFIDVGGTTYAFCGDGSEYRIADSVTPESK